MWTGDFKSHQGTSISCSVLPIMTDVMGQSQMIFELIKIINDEDVVNTPQTNADKIKFNQFRNDGCRANSMKRTPSR